MSKKNTRDTAVSDLAQIAATRRQALQVLGALAAISCGTSHGNDGSGGTTGGSGIGASGTTGGGGSSTGAGGATGGRGSTSGAGGSSSGGASGSSGGAGGQGDGGLAEGGSGADAALEGGQGAGAADAAIAAEGGWREAGLLPPPHFDDVASCTLTPTDRAGEGPFFIHEDEVMNDISIFRTDARDGQAGIELQLHFRLLDTDKSCNTPISGVQVYMWHTNALGFYSGFDDQNPDQPYMGAAERTPQNLDRFCRAAGITDKDGIVSFQTIFPGWYNGRAIHIHFVALRPGSGPDTASYRGQQYMVLTTQLYFDEGVSRMIHENNAPYTMRASGAAYNMYVKPETNVRPTTMIQGNVVVAALNILTSATGSRR